MASIKTYRKIFKIEETFNILGSYVAQLNGVKVASGQMEVMVSYTADAAGKQHLDQIRVEINIEE